MRFEKATIFFIFFFITAFLSLSFIPPLSSQPMGISARTLDALLQGYGFKALVRPKTGEPYDAVLPENLTGVGVSALRLRSGSLRSRGVPKYREFRIPLGVVEQPYAKRVVLVYHNLGNWSSVFYPLPGFSYLAPVLGLLGYDGSDLSGTNLAELDIRAAKKPISIDFSDLRYPEKEAPHSHSHSPPKCVYFDLHGSVEFDNVLPGNVCGMVRQGHFSIVMESGPVPSPASDPAPAPSYGRDGGKSNAWKIVGSLIGASVFFLALVVFMVLKVKKEQSQNATKKKKEEDERRRQTAAECGSRSERGGGEALRMTSFGNIRAPFAMATRTQPVLEDNYLP